MGALNPPSGELNRAATEAQEQARRPRGDPEEPLPDGPKRLGRPRRPGADPAAQGAKQPGDRLAVYAQAADVGAPGAQGRERGRAEAQGASKLRALDQGAVQRGPGQLGLVKQREAQVHVREVEVDELGAGEVGVPHDEALHRGAAQVRALQASPAHPRAGEIGPDQLHLFSDHLVEARLPQIRAALAQAPGLVTLVAAVALTGYLAGRFLSVQNLPTEAVEAEAVQSAARGEINEALERYEALLEASDKGVERSLYRYEIAAILLTEGRRDEALGPGAKGGAQT